MACWHITLSYDGTRFHGWQVQPQLATIQGTLAEAIRHLTGETVLPQGSGRTDAGVHALGQAASFELEARIPPANLLRALNRALPASIRVLDARHAAAGFHARHWATAKTYEYRILARGAKDKDAPICSPFLAPYVWACPWPLELERLHQAAEDVVGEHDFTSFAAADPDRTRRLAGEPESAVRTIFASAWTQAGELLVYRVTGSGFLHHMVRNLVGTFVELARGAGRGSMAGILRARDRAAAGPTAPAQGLYLVEVQYPAEARA